MITIEPRFDDIILNRIKFNSKVNLGPQVLSDLNLYIVEDILDSIIYRLETEILADHVGQKN